MTFREKLAIILFHPQKLVNILGWKWANLLLRRQVIKRSCQPDILQIDRGHYGWMRIEDEFAYAIVCIQATNLTRFVKETTFGQTMERVIEIGATSDLFLRQVTAKKKVGINVLPECIDQLRSQGIEGRLSSGNAIPAEEGEADLTLCLQTLEHVPDPIGFLRAIARITSDTGRIIMSIPWVPETNIHARYYGQPKPNQPESEYHIFEFCPRDFAGIAGHASLRIIEERKLPNYEFAYDPLSNALIRKHFAANFFPAVQAYILGKKSRASTS